jgi:23S rRNA pseudouridine1911/1915/1917 synthase
VEHESDRVFIFSITDKDREERIDSYLASQVHELTRSRVQELIKTGLAKVNGLVTKSSYRLKLGDQISLCIPPPASYHLEPEPVEFSTVYEDASLIVVDKPPGLVIHPAPGHVTGTLVHGLLEHCQDLSGIGGRLRPGIVHRLDKDTSGVLVVAKSHGAHLSLQRQFKNRSVEKVYLALSEGHLPSVRGVIDAPIGRDPKNRKRMAVLSTGGRPSRTNYVVLERLVDYDLLEVRLETGRTHQIRVHLAAIGHPLAGDPVYGHRKQRLPLKRQFLHAWRLTFDLPSTGRRVEFRAELADDLQVVLQELRQSDAG